MTDVGKPCFDLLKTLSVCPTKSSDMNKCLLCCFFTASVDPKNAPETIFADLVIKVGACMDCGAISLLSMVICKLQAHLALSNPAITRYDEPLLIVAYLRCMGWGHQASA